jgi:hypothetical protein
MEKRDAEGRGMRPGNYIFHEFAPETNTSKSLVRFILTITHVKLKQKI